MVAERNGAKVSRVFADVLYAEAARHLRRERAESEDQVQALMKKTEESQPRTSSLPVRKTTPSKKL